MLLARDVLHTVTRQCTCLYGSLLRSHEQANPFLWKEIELVDCHRRREVDEIEKLDDHDDTPLINILITLAK